MDAEAPAARPSPTALAGGLVLRTAEPRDRDQVEDLLTRRGDEHDAVDHRLVVDDPDLGWDACAVVVDGDRVVATATLLDEQVRVAGVTLPAGQVELVAVDPQHEHRGLARALMGWAHDRSAARGHVLQLMIGIPYFYRLFGYQYAIDIAPARTLSAAGAGEGAGSQAGAGSADPGAGTVRAARPDDLAALVALQDAAQAGADVAVSHPAARWRALLGQTASQVHVLERDGAVVASARVRTGDGLLLAEAAATDAAAAHTMLAALTARASADGEPVVVVHRAGTVTGDAWDALLEPADPGAEQYYVRIPDPAALLDALRPVLGERLAGYGGPVPDAVLISTFGAHYRLPVASGASLGPVEVGGPMQDPGAHRGFGVAPDRLGALLLGPRGLVGLNALNPDVYGNRELGAALFPPLSADVLSYYLPW